MKTTRTEAREIAAGRIDPDHPAHADFPAAKFDRHGMIRKVGFFIDAFTRQVWVMARRKGLDVPFPIAPEEWAKLGSDEAAGATVTFNAWTHAVEPVAQRPAREPRTRKAA